MIAPAKLFQFGTKAETLESVGGVIPRSRIPPFCYFPIARWMSEREAVLREISERFASSRVIVRSSARREDHAKASLAGCFTSIPNIDADHEESLCDAIARVIASYEKAGGSRHDDQVLIQRMVERVSMSGVVFTQDLNTGAPYYVVNYDDETGRTDTVTAGLAPGNRTLFVHRDAVESLSSDRFRSLLLAVREVEEATGFDALDVEFAVDHDHAVHLLQVRQIATRPNWNRGLTIAVSDAVTRIQTFVASFLRPMPGLCGRRSMFGTMPDWNPAEMIGIAPRPLACSLYRHLITDYAWRVARRRMGYQEPRGTRLMVVLAGKPYIDVRLSFNSFLPRGLDPVIGAKLVDAWLDRLAAHKELHDKVEFEVATTALTFDFDDLLDELIPGVLSISERAEYRRCLGALTVNAVSGRVADLETELDRVRLLEQRREQLLRVGTPPNLAVVSGLLEDCIALGTIPFSILARHAFIATSFLRSLVRRGIFTTEEVHGFMASVRTVASEFVHDLDACTIGRLDLPTFLARYGHLRPGTYDICSRRYDQREELRRGKFRPPERRATVESFHPSPSQHAAIADLLSADGFDVTSESFLAYLRDAIAAREYAKFIFTKNVSDALEILAVWGEGVGLSREELSYLDIRELLDALNTATGRALEQHLRDRARAGQAAHELSQAIHLPYLIERVEDVSIVPLLLHKPNFITKRSVRAPCVVLDGASDCLGDLAGKIVAIERADPGFDWVFGHPILGIVTKYGGANSHMAIRCAEFGLPAAIGCGEQIFDRVCRARAIELNCSEERIDPVAFP